MTHVRRRVLAWSLFTTLLMARPVHARADAGPSAERTDLLLELDPATFVLGGFSGHVRVRPAMLPAWSLGAGAYAMDLPSFVVGLDPVNRGRDWNARIRLGAAFFADRFLGDAPRGSFVGLELGLQRMRLENPRLGPGSAEYSALLVMPRAGYLWQPFGSGFYVMPWVGVGLARKVAGTTALGGETYHVPGVPMFATLHLGWSL